MATTSSQPPPTHHAMANNSPPPEEPSPPDASLSSAVQSSNSLCWTAQVKQRKLGAQYSSPPQSSDSPNAPPFQPKQLRPQRQPLYTPAALRPTDVLFPRPTAIPNRPRAPDTPPASKDNSFDSKSDASKDSPPFLGSLTTTATASSATTPQQNMKISKEAIEELENQLSKSTSDELKRGFGEQVSGLPATSHWKPDEISPDCAVCHAKFTWFFRRHHCRRCGNVVCTDHSTTNAVPLDQNAHFHPEGHLSRACDPCLAEWKVVEKLNLSRASSIVLASAENAPAATPITVRRWNPPTAYNAHNEYQPKELAHSQREGFGGIIWSTF